MPYVIENVEDARAFLIAPVLLCGSMFGLLVKRHRLFETNLFVLGTQCNHTTWKDRIFPGTPRSDGSRPLSVLVNFMASGTSHEMMATAMGIDWMPPSGRRPTNDLRESIPPAYTEFIGKQLLAVLQQSDVQTLDDKSCTASSLGTSEYSPRHTDDLADSGSSKGFVPEGYPRDER